MQLAAKRAVVRDPGASAAAAALLVCASIPAYIGWHLIDNLWGTYFDSPPEFYAAAGLSFWSLAAVLVALTLPLLRAGAFLHK
jgi:hypothetical protein